MATFQILKISQSADCSKFKITDETVYGTSPAPNKAAVTNRIIRIELSDGTYLTRTGQRVSVAQADIPFPIGGTNPDFLEVTNVEGDLAISVSIIITHSVTDTLTVSVPLVCYTMSGLKVRLQRMADNKRLESSVDYVRDTMRLVTEIESAKFASADLNISSSQNSLDRARYIIDNDFSQ